MAHAWYYISNRNSKVRKLVWIKINGSVAEWSRRCLRIKGFGIQLLKFQTTKLLWNYEVSGLVCPITTFYSDLRISGFLKILTKNMVDLWHEFYVYFFFLFFFFLSGINLATRKVFFRHTFEKAGKRLVKMSPDKTRLVVLSINEEQYQVIVFDTSAKKPVSLYSCKVLNFSKIRWINSNSKNNIIHVKKQNKNKIE